MKKAISVFIVFSILMLAVPTSDAYATQVVTKQTISARHELSAVIKSDGTLWAWGYNRYGQLGNGGTDKTTTPIKIMDNVTSVSLGVYHSAAIKNDGTLWIWGFNSQGQLGNGTTTSATSPIKIMDDVISVSLGETHSAAIKTDGSLWLWGGNEQGNLGTGTRLDSYTPIKIMDNVASVSLGNYHSAAIKTDGSLWMWGDTNHALTDIGTWVDSYTPIKIMDNVASVSLGNHHSAAIKTDGSLWMWGHNGNGQLGNGTTSYSYAPTPIKIMDSVTSVSLGGYHSAVIKTDGSLWTWGSNSFGQLGNVTNAGSTPSKIMENVSSVSLGEYHSVAIKTDGALWVWGCDLLGQLRYGMITGSNVPIKIMDNVMLPEKATMPTIPTTPSDWAEYEINQAISLGLIPDELQVDYQSPITRLDFCKLALTLYEKIKGEDSTIYLSNFSDIKSLSAEEQGVIGAIHHLGIVNGYEDGTFRPYNPISRQEAAVMLMRTAKVLGTIDPIESIGDSFDDCADVADWAMEGIKYVYHAGIMNGTDVWTEPSPEGTMMLSLPTHIIFSPYDQYTREQAMITYYRLYNKVTVSDNTSDSSGGNGKTSSTKVDYPTAYQNYVDAIENYKEVLEQETSNEGVLSNLEQSRISAMKEWWIIAPKNNIPDEVWLCLYEYTDALGELKVSSKDVDWATLKGQLEGSIDIPVCIAGSIASNDVTYSYNGVEVSFSGGLTLGKVGANIIIEWKGSGYRTLASNPDAVLSTYKSFNDQCLTLADDIINDEYQEIAEILTGYTGVADFLTKKISWGLNNLAKKRGLGDINKFVGECYEMYNLASSVVGVENPEEIVVQMQKLGTKDLLADTTITNVAVRSAMREVDNAKNDLVEAACNRVYNK